MPKSYRSPLRQVLDRASRETAQSTAVTSNIGEGGSGHGKTGTRRRGSRRSYGSRSLAPLVVGCRGRHALGRGAARRYGPPLTPVDEPLRILVTNDDGVAAPGLAVLVDALQALPDVEVTVIAPATNQSGVGDKYSTTPVTVAPATTANGDAATAVSGTPADSVLYAVQAGLALPPHVVVSGTNFGQNLGDITSVSGTVGAARTANRLGIPGIAVSAGFGTNIASSYAVGASFAAGWVSYFRSTYLDESTLPRTLNVNVPTCGLGSLRGFRAYPLGRQQSVSPLLADLGRRRQRHVHADGHDEGRAEPEHRLHVVGHELRQRHRRVQQRLHLAHGLNPDLSDR